MTPRPVRIYTGSLSTAGQLVQQAIATAEKIRKTVSQAREQVASQQAKDVLHHKSAAERGDAKKGK